MSDMRAVRSLGGRRADLFRELESLRNVVASPETKTTGTIQVSAASWRWAVGGLGISLTVYSAAAANTD